MRRLMAILLVAVTGSMALLGRAQWSKPGAGEAKITITQEKASLVIQIDGKPFTTYRFSETPDDPAWQRPYFWPVLAADGIEVTSDQMREQKKDPKADHPHQRSIWVGHGDVNGANHWTQSPEKQRHVRFTKVEGSEFVEELTWDSKGSTTPVLAETRTVRVITYADGSRGLEITSRFVAPQGDVQFRCKPLNVTGVEAGLCSVRIAKTILDGPADQKWITSGGLAKTNSGEAAARSNPATWCDYSGVIRGQKYGGALVDWPENPGDGLPFHVRLFGLLADIGPLNWSLKKNDAATFRHLIIIHAGDAAMAQVAEKARAWRDGR